MLAPVEFGPGEWKGCLGMTEIFRFVEDGAEHRLLLQDDGFTMLLLINGLVSEVLTAQQTRQRFPRYADAIDEVIANRAL
jgi:hypothetical protein